MADPRRARQRSSELFAMLGFDVECIEGEESVDRRLVTKDTGHDEIAQGSNSAGRLGTADISGLAKAAAT